MTDATSAGKNPPSTLGLSADEVLRTTRAVRKRLDLARPVDPRGDRGLPAHRPPGPEWPQQAGWDFIFVETATRPSASPDCGDYGLPGAATGSGGTGPAFSRMDFASDAVGRIAGSLAYLADHLHEVPLLLIPCLASSPRRTGQRARAGRGLGFGHPGVLELHAGRPGTRARHRLDHLPPQLRAGDGRATRHPLRHSRAGRPHPVAYTLGTDFKPGPRADADAFAHWNRW